MKTEKRLTMALSVLVALMMLAVPLASSSNLFVDGGQTNSNGDAPVVGASTGYTITFQLNADGKSLDQIENLNTIITNLNTSANFVDTTGNNRVTWYLGENNTILAIVVNDPDADTGNITIQQLINSLYDSNGASNIKKNGYTLTAWKDEGGNSYNADTSATDPILKSMTFAAQWELKQGFVEVPVNVDFGGDVKEYVKAYQVDADGKITVQVADTPSSSSGLLSLIETVGNLSTEGYVINNVNEQGNADPKMLPVYSKGVVTYGDNKALPADGVIPSTSTLKVTYTFNDSKYAKLIIHSIAFKDGKDVMLYADKDAPYNYSQIFNALKSSDVKAIDAEPVTNSVNYETKDGKYLLTGWDNGAANLESTYPTTAVEFTLDAKLNGYSIVFMVNGQYEVVFVNFGELTADKCTLGVSGLNHWAWIPFSGNKSLASITADLAADSNPFAVFDFNMSSNIKSIEDLAANPSYTDPDVPVAAIIACFESTPNTAYSVFDADTGYFGDNENITKIVIPGKADTDGDDATSNAANIPLPASNPVYDENMVFTGYDGYTTGTDASKYGAKDTTTYFKADVEKYKYTITFQDGDKVIGVLYMPEVTSNLDMASLNDAVAIQYDGKMYPKGDVSTYLDKILNSKKDGYTIKQWNDADGKKMISAGSSPATDSKNFTSLTSNLVLYADFDAKSYTIKYINAFGGVGQTQKAYVDQNVTLYGTGTFIQEGYELAGWSTVPGAGGDEYKLGGTFVLSGADYEKLVETSADGETTSPVTIELYSIWEFGGVTPGDNTEGSDNTALYLIAGMLLVIAVLGIAALFLLRRKN